MSDNWNLCTRALATYQVIKDYQPDPEMRVTYPKEFRIVRWQAIRKALHLRSSRGWGFVGFAPLVLAQSLSA